MTLCSSVTDKGAGVAWIVLESLSKEMFDLGLVKEKTSLCKGPEEANIRVEISCAQS